MSTDLFTAIPTKWIENIKICGNILDETVSIPLATYETPLWNSCKRGAKISQLCGGINVYISKSTMTRSVIFDCKNTNNCLILADKLEIMLDELREQTRLTGRFIQLDSLHSEVVGNLIFVRFSFFVGDASGHNGATKAAEHLMNFICEKFPQAKYASISGNFCTDKKTSAVNGILGRGRRCFAEIIVNKDVLSKYLRTDAQKICDLNNRKNLVGGIISGSIRSANAHFANMLLAFYLATGQDAANIVEGSQGIVYCENRQGDLYFSCSLPNLIIGSVGNGKSLAGIKTVLEKLSCLENRPIGANADRLAAMCGAIVLCGELSLMAAQTNPGELMRAHIALERANNKHKV